MVDFWEPLVEVKVSTGPHIKYQKTRRTFALTLSNDGGLTMEKQMRKTSVCGYDSGRNLS